MPDIIYADNFDEKDGVYTSLGVKELFKGTEEETLTWLKEMCKVEEGDTNKAFALNLWVMVGDSEKAIHVSSYVDPEQREANRDTRLKKYNAILELVREAMYDENAHSGDITERIMKLYT